MSTKAERAPWGDFPPVIRNGDLKGFEVHEEYRAAKSGDWSSAFRLVEKVITPEFIERLREGLAGRQARIVPVAAEESGGRNQIPLALAAAIAERLGLKVETSIVQSSRAFRTGSGADHRLVFNPTFAGVVEPGQDYLIVDDTLAMGGTLASLRGYIENRGGHVCLAAAGTAHEGALDMRVKPSILAGIEHKHGAAMNQFWQEEFGYGIDQLTQGEAGHLKAAASVDAIRARVIAARDARQPGEDPGCVPGA